MNGDLQRGLSVLHDMHVSIRSPHKYQFRLAPGYFTTLVRACKKDEDYEQIVQAMHKEGVQPTQEVLGMLIAGCGKATQGGGLQRAFDMFRSLRTLNEQREAETKQAPDTVTILIPKPTFASLLDAAEGVA